MSERALAFKLSGKIIGEKGLNIDIINGLFTPALIATLDQYSRIAFVIGGGDRARKEQEGVDTIEEKDVVGIKVTHDNAQELSEYLITKGFSVASRIPTNEKEATELLKNNTPEALVFGGLKIGQSTDAVAAHIASTFATEVNLVHTIILSNVKGVYTADPDKDLNVQEIRESNIEQLVRLKVLSTEGWRPGMHTPIDPVATQTLLDTPNSYVYFGDLTATDAVISFMKGLVPSSGTILHHSFQKTIYWK